MEQIDRRTVRLMVSPGSFSMAILVLTFRDCQRGAPLVTKNVQADAAVRVDVGVVDTSCEVNLGRLEGVVGGEVNGEEENTARVR